MGLNMNRPKTYTFFMIYYHHQSTKSILIFIDVKHMLDNR